MHGFVEITQTFIHILTRTQLKINVYDLNDTGNILFGLYASITKCYAMPKYYNHLSICHWSVLIS